MRTTLRGALLGMLSGVWALVSCTSGRKKTDARPESRLDREGHQLLKDLDRAGTRAYSEEGIAVFLVCEDMVQQRNGTPEVRPAPGSPNAELAATLRHFVEVLPRVRPQLTEDDVAKLIEVLAARDFGTTSIGITR